MSRSCHGDIMAVTLHGLFDKAAAMFPHRVAVLYDDGQTTVKRTYRQLQIDTEKVRGIFHVLNVDQEVIGLACSPNDILPSLILGVMSIPAAFHYIDLAGGEYSADGVRYLNIRYIIVDIDSLQVAGNILSRLDCIELIHNDWLFGNGLQLLHLMGFSTIKERQPLAYCITTSGTTGSPKVVKVPHACIVPNITHLKDIFQITEDDLLFLASPLTFDPSIVDLFLTLSSGAAILIIPPVYKMMPNTFVAMTSIRHRVTVLQVTPSLISSINSELLKRSLLSTDSKLRVLAFGGEKCPTPGMLRRWRSPANQTQFYNLYGTTEVSCWATCYNISWADFQYGDGAVPLGSALWGTDVEVRSEDGRPLTEGEGQLFIGGKTRVCFLKDECTDGGDAMPKSTEEGHGQRLMRSTGDWVRLKPDGQIIFMGRMNEQVKRHGMRLSLTTLEQVVAQLPFVHTAAAMVAKEKLILFVVCKHNHANTLSLEEQVTVHVTTSLPSQYQVNSLKMVSSLPLTKHGKVDKKELLKLAVTYDEKSTQALHSDDDIRSVIAQSWQSCLPQDLLSIAAQEDMFLLVGGDSFGAVRLVTSLEETFGHSLPKLLDLILHKTFRDVCEHLSSKLKHAICELESSRKSTANASTMGVQSDVADLKINIIEIGTVDKENVDAPEKPDGRKTDVSCGGNRVDHGVNSRKRKDKTSSSEFAESHKRNKLGDDSDNSDHNFSTLVDSTFCYAVSRGNRIIPTVKDNMSRTKGPGNGATLCKSFVQNNAMCSGSVNQHLQQLTVEEVWRYNTGKCVDASPLVVVSRIDGRGIVYMGSHSHWFCAISMETGQALWETKLSDRVESSACISGRYVVVGCYDYHIYALDAGDGSVYWTFKTGAEVKSSPVTDLQSSLVFVGSHDQHIYALDILMRKCTWKCDLASGSVFSSPCLSQTPRRLFAATLGGLLACIQPDSGQLLWEYRCDKPIFSSPAALHSAVVFGAVNGNVYCLNLDGEPQWTYVTGAPIFSSPVPMSFQSDNTSGHVTESGILIGSHDKFVYCLSASGKLHWKRKVHSAVYSTAFKVDLTRNLTQGKQELSALECTRHHSDNLVTMSCTSDHDEDIQQLKVLGANSQQQDFKHHFHSESLKHVKSHSVNYVESGSSVKHLELDAVKQPESDSVKQVQPESLIQIHSGKRSCVKLSGLESVIHPAKDSAIHSDLDTVIQLELHSGRCAKHLDCDLMEVKKPGCSVCKRTGTDSFGMNKPVSRLSFVAVCCTDGYLYLLNSDTGDICLSLKLGGQVFSSPVLVGNSLIVGCRDNNIYCFRLVELGS